MNFKIARDHIEVTAESPIEIAYMLDTLGAGTGVLAIEEMKKSNFLWNAATQADIPGEQQCFKLKFKEESPHLITVSIKQWESLKKEVEELRAHHLSIREELEWLYRIKNFALSWIGAKKQKQSRKIVKNIYTEFLTELTRYNPVMTADGIITIKGEKK